MSHQTAKLGFFDVQHPILRKLLFVLLGIAVAIIIIKIIQRIKTQDEREELKDVKKELKNIVQQPNYPDVQYKTWANNIAGMSGCAGWGMTPLVNFTDFYNIIDRMNNDADVLKLITAFGTRTFDCQLWGSQTINLSQFLSKASRIGADERGNLTKSVNEKFRQHGIKYRF